MLEIQEKMLVRSMESVFSFLYNKCRQEEIKMSLLEVTNLKKVYTSRFGTNRVEALKNINFSVSAGEYVAIMGESGSGKTTLLNILAALDKPTGGSVRLGGQDLSTVKESALCEFRRDNLGFVFQEFNLLDTLSVEDNIMLPLVLAGTPYGEMNAKMLRVAGQLHISSLLKKYPYEISGGQKQRVAVARALITSPKLVLADNLPAHLIQNPPTNFCVFSPKSICADRQF